MVDRDTVLSYILNLKEKSYAPATTARKVAAMRRLMAFLMKEGIPDFGLDGEYLITLAPYREKRTGVEMLSVGIKPVQKELAEISEFFNSEKKNINLLMLLVIAGSVIVIILMTFLVLSHLIRRNITEPVEQLAVAAGEIMEGNLDVEIEVHQGGEFEGLEQAFKEMLESLRRMIERSVGEQ